MRFWLAMLAICAEVIAYAMLLGLLGWKRGGGTVPILILIFIVGVTWTAIADGGLAKSAEPRAPEEEESGGEARQGAETEDDGG